MTDIDTPPGRPAQEEAGNASEPQALKQASREEQQAESEQQQCAPNAHTGKGNCPDDIASCDVEEDILPDEEMLYDLADLFKVFADTTRIKILYCLMGNAMCVACIATTVGATQSAVSHQLRILKQAHLVKFRRDGKNVIYELSDDHVYTMLSQGMTHLCE